MNKLYNLLDGILFWWSLRKQAFDVASKSGKFKAAIMGSFESEERRLSYVYGAERLAKDLEEESDFVVGISTDLHAMLKEEAKKQNISMKKMLTKILQEKYAELVK